MHTPTTLLRAIRDVPHSKYKNAAISAAHTALSITNKEGETYAQVVELANYNFQLAVKFGEIEKASTIAAKAAETPPTK